MLKAPNDVIVEILSKVNTSTLMALCHVSPNLRNLVIHNFSGIGHDIVYENSLSTGNVYASVLLFYVFEINVYLRLPDHGWPDTYYLRRYIDRLLSSKNLELIEWYDTKLDGILVKFHGKYFFKTACKYGLLSILEKYKKYACRWTGVICKASARSGNLELLEWCKSDGFFWCEETVCRDAILSGNLDAVKYCIKNGCALDVTIDLCSMAARSGNLKLLIYCNKNGCSLTKEAYDAAIRAGHFHIIKWLKENRFPSNESYPITALVEQRFEIFKWMIENGFKLPSYSVIASYGNLDLLKWCFQKGYPLDINERLMRPLQRGVTVELLKFCVEQKLLKFDENSCMNLACNGSIEVLKWAFYNGCPLDNKLLTIYYSLILNSREEVEFFKYCWDRGCTWNEFTSREIAESGNIELLRYYVEIGYVIDEKICNSAALSGKLEVLKYCVKLGYSIDNLTCVNAVKSGNLEVLKYCREQGCTWDGNVSRAALLKYNFKILRWVLDNGCPAEDEVYELYDKYFKIKN